LENGLSGFLNYLTGLDCQKQEKNAADKNRRRFFKDLKMMN